MVKDYMAAKVAARPAPNPGVVEADLEKILLQNPNAPKDASVYLDPSLF